MLEGCSKEPNVKSSHLWADILKVNPNKQFLFIKRIMLLHDVATKRGGKSSTVRLSQADWNTECDRCCFIGYVLESMESALDQDGNPLFLGSVLESVFQRAVEGIFSSI